MSSNLIILKQIDTHWRLCYNSDSKMSLQKQRLEAIVRGYVQGVGFRVFVLRQARALGVDGWVENREDGAVQVVAEGDRSDLLALADRLRDGPSEAEVQDVELSWQPYSGSFAGFEVRH